MSSKPSIVFAHGLWADGSCFAKVIQPLIADGYEVIATQNHLNTVADDAAAVRTSLSRAHGPVILAGHSYGGTVITAGGVDDRVDALVYICAFAPEDGDPTQADQEKFPQTAVFEHIEATDGRLYLRHQEFRSSPAICPSRSRRSSGPPRWGRWPTYSLSPCWVRRGRQDPLTTSSEPTTGRFSRISNGFSPSA
jgi:pimeloyl-ACP methyl ester carboxylesterase